MTSPSPFVARIAELLEAHPWNERLAQCGCEEDFGLPTFDGTIELWASHVAEVLVASLHTQEWTWSWPPVLTGRGIPGYGFSVPSRSEAVAEADPYMTIVSRFVSAWEKA